MGDEREIVAGIETQHAATRRRRVRWVAILAGVVVVLPAAFWLGAWLAHRQHERRVVTMLASGTPDERKRGAWLTADERLVRAAEFIARQLDLEREPDPDVRESFAYALGRCSFPQNFHTVVNLTLTDDSGYVRAAAWLAAARIDPQRTADLLRTAGVPQDAWDRLALAQARAEIGDMVGVADLFEFAQGADAGRRDVAARALQRDVAPLLEAVGRWPAEDTLAGNLQWSIELAREIAQRCVTLNLQAISDDMRRGYEAAARLRRNVGRITLARERLTRLLFSQ